MYRGTTPKHSFTTTKDISSAVTAYVTYKQNNEVIVEKSLSDITFEEGSYYVTLTQEETLRFSEREASVQTRAKLPDGSAWATKKSKFMVYDVNKDGVI